MMRIWRRLRAARKCPQTQGIDESASGISDCLPEYNSSITPLLKNAIDWASRSEPGEPSLVCFKEKIAVLMSASPGGLGGLRGLVHVRSILGNIGVLVLPDQKAISNAHQAFDENGNLKDESQQAAILQLGHKLVTMTVKLNPFEMSWSMQS